MATYSRGITSKIYKELKRNQTSNTQIIQFKKWGPDVKGEFSAEETERAQKHLKKYSTSFHFQHGMEMKIKITLRY